MKTRILALLTFPTFAPLYALGPEISIANRTISPYLPDVDIVITTQDAAGYSNNNLLSENKAASRTRMDWPYKVSYAIKNVDQTNNTLPSGLTFYQVDQFSSAQAYPAPVNWSLVDGMTRNPSQVSTSRVDASFEQPYSSSDLAAAGIVAGEQTFSVRSIKLTEAAPLTKVLMESQPLDLEMLQVLPKLSGEFDTLGGTMVGSVRQFPLSSIPALSVKYRQCYPNSSIFIQAYKGSPRSAVALLATDVIVTETKYDNTDYKFPSRPIDITTPTNAPSLVAKLTAEPWTVELVSLTPVSSTASFPAAGAGAVGIPAVSDSTSGKGSAVVVLNAVNDYSLTAGTYLLERGDVEEILPTNSSAKIRASITTNE